LRRCRSGLTYHQQAGSFCIANYCPDLIFGENTVRFVSHDFDPDTMEDTVQDDDTALGLTSSDADFHGNSQQDFSTEHARVSSFVNHIALNQTPSGNDDVHNSSGISGFPQMDESPRFSHHSNVSVGASPNMSMHTPIQIRGSHHTSPAMGSVTSMQGSWPFANAHEARLFHHYVTQLSPWVGPQRLEEALSILANLAAVRRLRQKVSLWTGSAQKGSALSSTRQRHLCSFFTPSQRPHRLRRQCITTLCEQMLADPDNQS